MVQQDDEERLLRAVALQNAAAILAARQRAEQELVRAKETLELKTRELAHSLALMRATLDSTTDGILVTARDGTVTDVNERFLAMWRVPREVLASRQHRPILEAIASQFADRGRFLDRIEEIEATAPAETFDVLDLADGRVFERSSRTLVVDDRHVGRVWSFRDITGNRRAEEALREEKRVLELLNRTGTVLSSRLDLDGVAQAVTDAGTELSGAKFGAFLAGASGRAPMASLLYALSGLRPDDFAPVASALAGPLFAAASRGEGPIRCADVRGDPRFEKLLPGLALRSYLAVPVVSRSGEVIGGLCFGHPEPGVFTERAERIVVGMAAQAAIAIDNARMYEAAQQAAEERRSLLDSERAARSEAERASAMKDEFLATVSHELRTPLNAILGWSQVLRLPAVSPSELRRGLAAIERNARAQTQLIEDLLDMSRIASGKLRVEIQPLMPGAVVEAALETVRAAAEAKGIRLSAVLDPAAGPVAGDPSRLQQVVWNLLSNAIKFTGRQGSVEVRLRRGDAHVEISVADTGMGIAPEFVPHVFDRFRQADGSSTRAASGLGLGLAIVKQLVELHGGSVRAESPGPGRGAVFTVEIPLLGARLDHVEDGAGSGSHPVAPPRFRPLDLAGIKVLVVDDEPDARELIARVLGECRAEVVTASTAVETLTAIERDRPHVLVSDIGMPNVDGYRLLRMIRELGPARGGGLPAIALTAFARSEDRTLALHAGFLVHVAKPIEPAELVATVASVVGRTGGPIPE